MTNDLTTVGGVLQQTIDDLETNLQAMGVSDAEFDPVTGILGLIARIPEIEPTPVGVDLDMSLTLTAPNVANKNVPITLTATLQGTYDDTTEDNVDVNAGMQGATIEFYNGQTLLGTAITNNQGIATFEYIPTEIGTLILSAVFDGTELWDNAISNTLNINVNSLTLTSSADVVSTGDTITLTATYLDYEGNPVENETIDFINTDDDSILGTATTDSNGECSVSYLVQNSNLLNIRATNNMILSKTSVIYKYIINETISNLINLPGRWFQRSTSYAQVNRSTKYDGETEGIYYERTGWSSTWGDEIYSCVNPKKIIMQKEFYVYPEQWEHWFLTTDSEIIAFTARPRLLIGYKSGVTNWDSSKWGSDVSIFAYGSGSSTNPSLTQGNWYTLKAIYDNGVCTLELWDNNDLIDSYSITQELTGNITIYSGVAYGGSYDGSSKNKNWNKNIHLTIY